MVDELLKCPFCSGGETIIHENKGTWNGTKGYGEPISVEVRHWCEEFEGMTSRMLAFVGKDRESAIRRWNKRGQFFIIFLLIFYYGLDEMLLPIYYLQI